MAGESSFDVVSKIDRMEVDNALNQTAKELSQRFDFKGTGASIEWKAEAIEIRANAEERAKAALEVLREKLVKRQVSLKVLDAGDPKQSGKEFMITVALKEGIAADLAKTLGAQIRSEAPKSVKVTTLGDTLRVTSKNKDDLQATMALLRGTEVDMPLQFINFR